MNKIRNVAIIAHVDHGKTSLVNEMLKQGGVFRANQEVAERVMDSNALERERGITILSKNTAINYKGYKINIVDTPGHVDFGGEVERVLKMVDGVLLVVDAFEGPMPQTRTVLLKSLELDLPVIVVVNKVDKKDARIKEVVDEVLELFLNLNAGEKQLDSPFIFASARFGYSSEKINEQGTSFQPLLDKIISYIPAPKGNLEKPFSMLVSSAEHNDFLGKLAVGRIENGSVKVGDVVCVTNFHDESKKYNFKVVNIFTFEGLKRLPLQEGTVGDIICIAGNENITIGDSISDKDNVVTIPFVKISEPSVEMTFSVNNSPFAGKEGKYCTSRHLRERLFKEMVKDLSLKVFETDSADNFRVLGRGEMHFSILIENMRREGYEFQVSMPKVIIKIIEGKKCEPIEQIFIDVPEINAGTIISTLCSRKGELVNMSNKNGRTRIEMKIPTRALFGYKTEFLTDTKGEGVISQNFFGYEPYKGQIERRNFGALIAFEAGEAVQYGLYNAQERGKLLIGPGTKVYAGMIVGMNPKNEDISVNVCKKKHLSNMRSSSSDDSLKLEPLKPLTLEECMEFLDDDELLEVTPKSLRLRKVFLDETMRVRMAYKKKNEQ